MRPELHDSTIEKLHLLSLSLELVNSYNQDSLLLSLSTEGDHTAGVWLPREQKAASLLAQQGGCSLPANLSLGGNSKLFHCIYHFSREA